MIVQSLIYSFNRDWVPIHAFGLFYASVVLLAIMIIPESPKWYYSMRRFDEARTCLKQIGLVNGKRTVHKIIQKFDTEVDTLD